MVVVNMGKVTMDTRFCKLGLLPSYITLGVNTRVL